MNLCLCIHVKLFVLARAWYNKNVTLFLAQVGISRLADSMQVTYWEGIFKKRGRRKQDRAREEDRMWSWLKFSCSLVPWESAPYTLLHRIERHPHPLKSHLLLCAVTGHFPLEGRGGQGCNLGEVASVLLKAILWRRRPLWAMNSPHSQQGGCSDLCRGSGRTWKSSTTSLVHFKFIHHGILVFTATVIRSFSGHSWTMGSQSYSL